MEAPVTALWAALLTPLYFFLTIRVIRVRRRRRIDMGTGGDRLMERYVRAQANFVESVPFGLILLLLLEVNGMVWWVIGSLGAALFAGRVCHAWSFSVEDLRPTSRTIGMVLTQAAMFLAAALLLFQPVWR